MLLAFRTVSGKRYFTGDLEPRFVNSRYVHVSSSIRDDSRIVGTRVTHLSGSDSCRSLKQSRVAFDKSEGVVKSVVLLAGA